MKNSTAVVIPLHDIYGECGSSEFYVKSISRIIEIQKLLFLTNEETLNFYFDEYLQFLKAKIYQTSKFRVFQMEKMAFFGCLESQKLISREIWVTENGQISTLCSHSKLRNPYKKWGQIISTLSVIIPQPTKSNKSRTIQS